MDRRNAIKKRYYFITGVLFLLGLILLFLPHRKNKNELPPEDLLLAISNEDRFFSPDDVARFIISGDPSVQLIDVRTPDEYEAYSLPGSINIPLEKILDKDEKGNLLWEGYLNDNNKTTIYYSNGTVYANQAWMLAKRLNFKHNYVMKGGLNEFFETVFHAKKPLGSAPESEHEIYSFRKAVSVYFGGGGIEVSSPSEAKTQQKLSPKKKKKEGQSSGGC